MTHNLSPRRPDSPPGGLPRWSGFVLLAAAVVTLAGCKDEAIKHYEVPREKEIAPSTGGPMMGAGKEERLVTGFVMRDGQTWFFKLAGPAEATGKARREFQAFLEKNVNFDKTPDAWPLPDNWRVNPRGPKERKAAYLIGPEDAPVELAVTAFPGDVGGDLANVNRWRTKVGLPDAKNEDLARLIKPQKIGGLDGKIVDFTRPGIPIWTVPPGWENGPLVPFSKVTYKISAKDPDAKVTVGSFEKFDLLSNVIRWRGQVGMPKATDEQMLKELTKVDVNGLSADRMDYAGTNPQTGKKQRLVVLVLSQGTTAWVIKIIGAPEAVSDQMNGFEAFVNSIKFPAGEGDR
jgi:hypothetical protein